MSAILELQELARKSSTDIVELVMSAYTIAKKLKLKDFVDWCNTELEGYSDSDKLPEYRYIYATIMVSSRLDGNEITANWLDIEETASLQKRGIAQSISSLVGFQFSGDEKGFSSFQFDYNKNQYILRRGYNRGFVNIHPSYSVAFSKFHISEIHKIFGAIRKIISDWALECENQGIKGENWVFKEEDKRMAPNTIYNIGSVQSMANHNADTMINQSSQNISITKGDFSSLANFLIDKGINEPAIQELKDIIDIEPNLATEGMTNNKIQGWIGKIIIGGSLVAKGVAIETIVEAIKYYLGF